MGFFDGLKKFLSGLGKSKFEKITKDDINKMKVRLAEQDKELNDLFEEKLNAIDAFMEKGRNEASQQRKMIYAQRIKFLREEVNSIMQRIMFTMYNASLVEKLALKVDENSFFNSSISMNDLLADSKGLALFLNNALGTRLKAEEILTNADDAFKQIEDSYEPNEKLYGIGKDTEDILASFDAGKDDLDPIADKKKDSEAQG